MLNQDDVGATRPVEVANLHISYGGFVAIKDLTITIPAGELIGVVGPNGAGKTTLLNAISGFTHISKGSITWGDTRLDGSAVRQRVRAGIVRGFQTVRLMERETVITNVLVGTERLPHPNVLAQLLGLPPQRRARVRDLEAAWQVIDLLGLSIDAYTRVDELPFASRRLVEVARVLVSRPPVILLDEPAAGLDHTGRIDLSRVLARVHAELANTMVIVEHDVDLVKRLCSHAIALDSGELIATGTPDAVFADPAVQTAYFGRTSHAVT